MVLATVPVLLEKVEIIFSKKFVFKLGIVNLSQSCHTTSNLLNACVPTTSMIIVRVRIHSRIHNQSKCVRRSPEKCL
jgi:hypothetical protein